MNNMQTVIEGAIKAYAQMANMTEKEVMIELSKGNEVITRSVQMLMFSVA